MYMSGVGVKPSAASVMYLNICKHIHSIAENNKIDHVEEPDGCAIQFHKTVALVESHPKLIPNNEKTGSE